MVPDLSSASRYLLPRSNTGRGRGSRVGGVAAAASSFQIIPDGSDSDSDRMMSSSNITIDDGNVNVKPALPPSSPSTSTDVDGDDGKHRQDLEYEHEQEQEQERTEKETIEGLVNDSRQYTDAQYRRVLRKQDWILLPLMWLCVEFHSCPLPPLPLSRLSTPPLRV